MMRMIRYKEAAVVSDGLYIRIVWFARIKGGPDVDNIIKPMVDALKGIIYTDDALISQCLSVRIDLESFTKFRMIIFLMMIIRSWLIQSIQELKMCCISRLVIQYRSKPFLARLMEVRDDKTSSESRRIENQRKRP